MPRYLFLDEATSAMDFSTERSIYTLLANSGMTYVSVSHRDFILGFHQHELRLLGQGRWQIRHCAPESPTAVAEGWV
jgi:putative ATP-binding cassette transporter